MQNVPNNRSGSEEPFKVPLVSPPPNKFTQETEGERKLEKPDFPELLKLQVPIFLDPGFSRRKKKQSISVGEERSSLSVSFSVKTTGQSALGGVGAGAG